MLSKLLKMYEFATGTWLFTPEATDGLSRDIVHLAQMTLRTGQEHNESVLKQYEGQRKQYGLRGMLHDFDVWCFIHLSHVQIC